MCVCARVCVYVYACVCVKGGWRVERINKPATKHEREREGGEREGEREREREGRERERERAIFETHINYALVASS